VGADFSEAMLAVARQRQNSEGGRQDGVTAISGARANPKFLHCDVQRLPFPDNSFEVVAIGYGLRNLENLEAGLCEMQRVAKPGGRLLVLDFGKPANALWRALYFAYLRTFVPLLGKLFGTDATAYAYISESLEHYPAQLGVAAKMHELGLAEIRTFNLLGGIMSINCAEK
jgi:demethylmenaquinone methyltransferase/2-methoxy-6-polyprenyl-1,4-benzoquinol methylase